jgi:hypothetical protein
MRIDDRVSAQVALFAAKAMVKVAELEAQEKATPNTTQTSNTRLHIARKLKGARTLAASWMRVTDLMEQDGQESDAVAQRLRAADEFPAPDRTVAWAILHEGKRSALWCNRNSHCRGWATEERAARQPNMIALRSEDLPEGAERLPRVGAAARIPLPRPGR